MPLAIRIHECQHIRHFRQPIVLPHRNHLLHRPLSIEFRQDQRDFDLPHNIKQRISVIVVLVGVDVGEDPAQGAENSVDGGGAGQLRV